MTTFTAPRTAIDELIGHLEALRNLARMAEGRRDIEGLTTSALLLHHDLERIAAAQETIARCLDADHGLLVTTNSYRGSA